MKTVLAIAGVFLLAAGLTSDARLLAGASSPPALTVVYVGADDCGPCRQWRNQHRAPFLDSQEFGRLRYREVIAPRLRDLLSAHEWPSELTAIRDLVRSRPGAPQWVVLRHGETIAWDAGVSAWGGRIWPTIRAETRRP